LLKNENHGFDPTALVARSAEMAAFLKALGHDGRLAIMCYLGSGPKSVGELEALLSAKQAVVSQHLARLRLEGLVTARREGQTIYYSILDPKVTDLLWLLDRLFRGSDKTDA
jgi:ArsR family transcriptional regulator